MLIRNNASETAVLSLGWTTVSIYTLPFSCWCQLLLLLLLLLLLETRASHSVGRLTCRGLRAGWG